MGKGKNKTAVVTCPYCGGTQMMEVPEAATEEQLQAYAVKVCTCDEAKKEQRKSSLEEKLNMLFGDGSASNGFDEPLSADQLSRLKSLCVNVLDSTFINVTVTFPTGDKARITTVTDRIKVTRESKNHAETKI